MKVFKLYWKELFGVLKNGMNFWKNNLNRRKELEM